MAVQAKFICRQVAKDPAVASGGVGIRLEAVTDGSPENDKFFQATPAGMIDLEVVNPAAAEQFEVGKEYLVSFTPAGEPAKKKAAPKKQAAPKKAAKPSPKRKGGKR